MQSKAKIEREKRELVRIAAPIVVKKKKVIKPDHLQTVNVIWVKSVRLDEIARQFAPLAETRAGTRSQGISRMRRQSQAAMYRNDE